MIILKKCIKKYSIHRFVQISVRYILNILLYYIYYIKYILNILLSYAIRENGVAFGSSHLWLKLSCLEFFTVII